MNKVLQTYDPGSNAGNTEVNPLVHLHSATSPLWNVLENKGFRVNDDFKEKSAERRHCRSGARKWPAADGVGLFFVLIPEYGQSEQRNVSGHHYLEDFEIRLPFQIFYLSPQ